MPSESKPPKPVFWVSDVHLGAVPDETERAFRRWLRHVGEKGSRLIVAGDLFDFWFEYRHVVPGRHVRVLAQLAELVESGVGVTMTGGNHDWWGGDYLRRRIGVDFHRAPLRAEIAGTSVLIAHGDGLGKGDLPYKALRAALRAAPTRWAFRWLHPDLGARLARRLSRTRAHAAAGAAATGARARPLFDWAAERLASDPTLGMVVAGHAHEPQVAEVAPGRFYVNTGDWVVHRSYATTGEDGRPILHEWTG